MYGMKDQLDHELKSIEGIPDDFERHTRYLSRVIHEALGECIQSAQKGMDYLRALAKAYLDNGLDITWVNPLGMLCIQNYPVMRWHMVRTRNGDHQINISLPEDTHKQNPRRNTTAFPPNFIHSLDASHLGLTVLAMSEAGVSKLAMVHDSYGTSASNVKLLHRCLRESAVKLYTEFDPLGDLERAFINRGGDPSYLPVPPEKGNLDIRCVLDSQYFFM